MSEFDAWLETQTEDQLVVERVGDDLTAAYYLPCRTSIKQAFGQESGSLWSQRKPLAHFHEGDGLITTYPLVTRPGPKFLAPKYPWLSSIDFEMEDLTAPEDEWEAIDLFDALPDGFVKDWRWGLGIHKLYKPVLDTVGLIKRPDGQDAIEDRLLISRGAESKIDQHGYVLSAARYDALRLGLYRTQAAHQRAASIERIVLAHNSMLTQADAATYPQRATPYKPDTIFKLIDGSGPVTKLSAKDQSSLVSAVQTRASELARDEPDLLAGLHKTVQLASLDALIDHYQVLLARTGALERDWQKLLHQNPFLLSLVFGFPIVLVAQQAHVGGMTLDGDGARFADFLLKNEITQSAALVELKRPGTALVTDAEYAGVRNISTDLTKAVMQVLDQRYRLLTNLPITLMNSGWAELQGWYVSCVVIAGRSPADQAQAKALEYYRNSLKDVVILTFDELLSRLVSLRDFLATSDGAVD